MISISYVQLRKMVGAMQIFSNQPISLKRVYWVQWKKPSINQDELAKLYWNEGLKVAEIAEFLGVGVTTAQDHLYRLKASRTK